MKTDWSKYTMTGYEMDIVQAISILQAEKAKQIEYRKLRFFPWKKVRHLQIIGITHPARAKELGIESCAYFSDLEGHLLMIGPPENKIQMYLNSCTNEVNTLEVSYTQVQNLKLSHLAGITTLNLSENVFLSRVEGIPKLEKLQQLVLFHTAVGPELDINHNLELEYLHIGGTNIIRVEISHDLPRMRSFLAQNSKICSAECISNFPGVKYIDFSSTHIEKLPSLDRLIELEQLALQRCAIKELPQIENLSKLRILWLINTAISSLDNIVFPNSLDALFLGGMRLKKLPNSLRLLDNLSVLDLSYICLDELPDWLPELNLNFYYLGYGHGINLKGAKIKGINMSIFDQPQDVILKWFEERRNANTGSPLNEVKVVFLGDGEAGKTHTISRLLKDGKMLLPSEIPEDATPGIVITDKTYRIGDRDVQVHFWDFGGQEILHSMHRMFLTERTLYVVLLNARDNTQDERARYWLHNIRSFAGNAPVLLVLNKTDQNEYATVNISDLRRLSPGLPEAVRLSALRDSPEDFNRKLTGAMLDAISRIDTINTFFPNSWKQVKNALQTMETPYIRGDAYKRLCDQHRVDGSIQKSVLDLFKTLGVSFYYPGAKLEDYVVLRPDWITNAIYIILFNKRKEVKNGLISHETIYRLLNPRAGDTVKRVLPDAVYRPEEINYVLDVVRRFRLSYLVEDGMEFIPMLCAGNSLPVAEEYEKALDTLEFRMVYDYLPNNVIHRLMVELRQHLDQTNVWLTGARFREGSKGFSAVVKTEGNLLRIFVRAEKDRYTADMYLDTIRDALERINDTMGLKVAENQVVYKADGIVECFDYDDLLLSLELGDTMVASRKLRRKIPIADVLSQTDHQVDADRAALIGHLLSACRKLQGSSMYWDAREDDRNTYIRDLLRTRGYLVFDQTLCGASASGKQAGELDLEIRREQDMPWTIFEALNLSGKGKTQMDYWDGHLKKLLDNYNAHGLPFLFHVSYVACGKDQFSGVCGAYADHLRFHSPEPYSLQFTGPLRTMPEGYGENHFLQAYQCVYDCNGFPTTVYHIFVRLGA